MAILLPMRRLLSLMGSTSKVSVLEGSIIRVLDLSTVCWMCYGSKMQPNALIPTELPELMRSKICPIISDDVMGNTEAEDDSSHETDCS